MGYQGEMSLKGLNRNQFEAAMMKILRYRLKTVGKFKVYCTQSTFYMEPEEEDVDMDLAFERVSKVFGLKGEDVVSYKGVKSNDNGDAGLVLVVEAASGKAQDVVTALESYKQDQVAFYGNYAEFAQAQSNVENAIISSKGDRVVMVIASNECTADLNSAVDSALNS